MGVRVTQSIVDFHFCRELKKDDNTDQEMVDHNGENPGESTLLSEIEEDDMKHQ